MNRKFRLIAAIAVFSIAAPALALAQSAYTSGTAASSQRAGYSSSGQGRSLYDYAPDHR
jgi:hypothetical protein